MTIIYLLYGLAIVKLFQYFYSKTNANGDETITKSTSCLNDIDIETSNEKPIALGKNKFLYPEDEFVSHRKVKKYKPKNFDIK